MLILSNSTTARLEGQARRRGLDLGIVKSPDNALGLFFVVRVGSKMLSRWVSLGWTAAEARQRVRGWENSPCS